jgi:hypothetical protein
MKPMSVLFAFFLIFSIPFISFGQEKKGCKKNISSTIQNYIKTNYEGVKKVKYYQDTKEKIAYIEATFEFKEDEYSLKFLNDSLIETEIEISFKELPMAIQKNIQSSLDSNFSKYKILEVQKIDIKDNPMYEVSFKGYKEKRKRYFEFFFDKNGMLVSKTKISIKPIPSQF